ncbi:ABC transporter ATP-binding protein [Candidatus Alkanophaga liquidiphilum]|nr:MAG: lipoprotein-releasing system ATP-binding protein LolD [Candidatus Alkanophagales archaeon]
MEVVRLVEVTKVYELPRGSVKALDDVSMSVGAGDFVSIMGPSGSGKSTLLNIIGCLDTPTSGEVFIGGARVSGLSDDELTRLRLERMGFVFQHFNLIPTLTALENVEFPMLLRGMREREAKERGKQLLRAVGLDEGLGEHKPSELSGGEQQRVAIARALANDPDIILADEPTGNLDSKTSKSIMELLKMLNERGRTIIVVTHDPLVASYTARTLKLVDGRLVG